MTLRSAQDGSATGELTRGWSIGQAVNGGALMALAATAMAVAVTQQQPGHADPLALSAYFLSAAGPGAIRADTQVLRQGRTMSTAQCSLGQPDQHGNAVERVRALASFGNLAHAEPVHRSVEAPPIAPPEECVSSAQAPPEFLEMAPLVGRIDLRFDEPSAGWVVGSPSGRGRFDAWLRFADGREPDPIALLFVLDALPPVAFDLGIMGWVPTLEFSGHVRGRPAPGWLQVQASTRILTGNLMEEDATIWDSTGRLVARSRQLCSVRLPENWAPAGR